MSTHDTPSPPDHRRAGWGTYLRSRLISLNGLASLLYLLLSLWIALHPDRACRWWRRLQG